MTKNIWFCWEKTMSGLWGPVCYHGRLPDTCPTERAGVVKVPDALISGDTPLFGELMRRFPAPVVVDEGGTA